MLTAIATRASDPTFGIDALASQLAVTSRYIQRILEETGTTFSEHLLEQRLRHAWRLLSDPHHRDLKVASIAYDCGFNDLGTFNRVFRRRFGETPTAVRGARNARRLRPTARRASRRSPSVWRSLGTRFDAAGPVVIRYWKSDVEQEVGGHEFVRDALEIAGLERSGHRSRFTGMSRPKLGAGGLPAELELRC